MTEENLACTFVRSFLSYLIFGILTYIIHVLKDKRASGRGTKIKGCSKLEKETIWVKGIPKLMTESAFRLVNVNTDGVLDIIFGFATGAEGHYSPEYLCDIYFNGSHPCFGGVLALDGRSGEELWRHYTQHEIFSLNCGRDLDGDGVLDCLAAGRVATFEAVSGRTGLKIWSFKHAKIIQDMNFYTGQFIPDQDGDGIAEVINTHGGDPFGEPGSETRLSGKIFIISGATGEVLQWVTVPDKRECYYSPVLYTDKTGNLALLFGTGGETHGGSLWYITVNDLYKGSIHKAKSLFTDAYKGIMTPPVLVDMTEDGVTDIMFNTFNSSSLLIDGDTFQIIWNFTYPGSETYATPGIGFYNDDGVPDFMVHWQYGPGFPIYYHSVTTILDGTSGKPLIEPYIKDAVGVQTSPLTISVEGHGNDIFLFYTNDCLGHEGQGGKYTFVKGTNVHEKSRSDICQLRFNSEGVSRLHALTRNVKYPGLILYDSVKNKDVEHASWKNTTNEALKFLASNPEHLEAYMKWKNWLNQSRAQGTTNMKTDIEAVGPDYDYLSEEVSPNNVLEELINQYVENKIYSKQQSLNEHLSNPYTENTNTNDYKMDHKYKVLHSVPTNNNNIKFMHKSKLLSEIDKKLLNVPSKQRRTNKQRKRIKKHVGIHDENGLQRVISTGTLAPTLLRPSHPDHQQSIDIIFATYWFYPAKTEVILPSDQQCIDGKMGNQIIRFDPKSKYYGMDDDGYEHAITYECLKSSKHGMPQDGVYESQDAKDPYIIHMGQLTVYRMRLKCHCNHHNKYEKSTSKCGHILPFEQQTWPSYMGPAANGHAFAHPSVAVNN